MRLPGRPVGDRCWYGLCNVIGCRVSGNAPGRTGPEALLTSLQAKPCSAAVPGLCLSHTLACLLRSRGCAVLSWNLGSCPFLVRNTPGATEAENWIQVGRGHLPCRAQAELDRSPKPGHIPGSPPLPSTLEVPQRLIVSIWMTNHLRARQRPPTHRVSTYPEGPLRSHLPTRVLEPPCPRILPEPPLV